MARIIKPTFGQAFCMRADFDEGTLSLVKGGKRAYLWIDNGRVATFAGAGALRKLAHAILAEVGARETK